jgi:hypothetical protein
MTDLIILNDLTEELRFEPVNINVFQIYARQNYHDIYIQPTIEDAKKIRDWLNSFIIESEE